MQALQLRPINLLLGQLGIAGAVVQPGPVAAHAVMALLAAVETKRAMQTKEPPHLPARKVSSPMAGGDLTLSLGLRYPLDVFPALPPVVAGSVAPTTDDAAGRGRRSPAAVLRTVPNDVAGDAAVEADGFIRASPRIVRTDAPARVVVGDGHVAAQIARRHLGGIGTGVGPVPDLAAVETLGADVLVPVPIGGLASTSRTAGSTAGVPGEEISASISATAAITTFYAPPSLLAPTWFIIRNANPKQSAIQPLPVHLLHGPRRLVGLIVCDISPPQTLVGIVGVGNEVDGDDVAELFEMVDEGSGCRGVG